MTWRPNQRIDRSDAPPPVKNSPDSPPNTVQKPIETHAGKKVDENRSHNIRRDTDDDKNFTVTLIDIDTTIVEHLQNMQLSVEAGGDVYPVPVFYSNPERWKAIQKDGFMRDHRGKVQLPAIAIARNTIARNEGLKIFNRYPEHLSMPFKKKYSEKNQYDKFNVLNNLHDDIHELHNVNLPDHYTVTYEVVIWTDVVTQNNSLVERISYETEDYWGDQRRFKFRTTVSDFNLQTEVTADQDRMVKSTFNLQVYAYLLPEYQKQWKQTTQKAFTPRKVIFGVELDDKDENFPTDDDNKGYTGQNIYNTPVQETISLPTNTYPSEI